MSIPSPSTLLLFANSLPTTDNSSKEPLVGAHTSIAGGHHLALSQAMEIGANITQIFTANQRQWKSPTLSRSAIRDWQEAKDRTGISLVMSHASYLINLGSQRPDLLKKSQEAFFQEIKRCLDLDITYLNFHPGAATGAPREECIARIIESLLTMTSHWEHSPPLTLLLETTAGQGSCIGHTFEELAMILEGVKGKLPIGVCIDTCHIWSGGYPVDSEEGWRETLRAFDDHIGIDHLHALHVNDSQHPKGARKDRHASLGDGEIGKSGFVAMLKQPELRPLPMFLETPDGENRWPEEISWMRGQHQRFA
ncbi:MAG: deoxyribonuclease IV [Chlamydiota bacterium]|nr:deoxyribonuclease IV [Chlamydiota bacterium]